MAWDVEFCVSNKLPGEANSADPDFAQPRASWTSLSEELLWGKKKKKGK